MTPPTLAQLRAIAEAATSGPWRNGSDPCHFGAPEVTDGKTFAYYVPNDADAAHIAAFNPATALALLDRIERLERLVAEACGLVTAAIELGAPDYSSGEMFDADQIDAKRAAIRKELSHAE